MTAVDTLRKAARVMRNDWRGGRVGATFAALAEWLDVEADDAEVLQHVDFEAAFAQPLAVARAYLGESS